MLASIVGCKHSSSDPQRLYAEARQKADAAYETGDSHERSVALQLADEGFSLSAADPLLNYRLRLLKAELIASSTPDETLRLLAAEPPPAFIQTEIPARREFIQALAHGYKGDSRQAQEDLEQAYVSVGNRDPKLLTRIVFNQGYYALNGKDQDKVAAEKYYRRALELAKSTNQLKLETDSLINIGDILAKAERYDAALPYFLRAREKSQQQSHLVFEQQWAIGDLGWCYLQLGDFANAEPLLSRAADMAGQLQDVPNQRLWLTSLGILFHSQNNLSMAETYYQKSLTLAQHLNDLDNVAISYHNLAEAELKRRNLDQAENFNKLAYAAKKLSPKDHYYPYLLLTSAEIAAARKEYSHAEGYLNAIIRNPKIDTSLRWQAQSDLANLYVAEGNNAKADAIFFQALRLIENAREEVRLEERRLSILDAWPYYDDYIRFLANHGKDTKALQIAEFSRGRTLAEAFGIGDPQKTKGLQITAIESFLRRRKQVLLAYWISDQESYLWVISPATFKLLRLPDKQSIDREVEAYNREIREHEDIGNSAHGQRLYEMLIKPAEALLPHNPNVIIVPNRSLYKLNFETLVVPGKNPHYWIEDAVVENASSIALLVQSRRQPAKGMKKLLLMGAPIQVTDDFPALRFAGEEIASVKSHFPRDQETVLTGKDATPEAYNAAHPGEYQFIHLVTHGISNQTSPLDSAIVLSSGSGQSFKLYARDIKDIRPLHADLVTISACYGVGETAYAGEGPVGLAWAFMRAGSHQVIAALWEVGDATMPKLMDNFYSQLQSGKSIPEALRLAKLNVVHASDFHKRPYYWASLQLYTGP
jgi:CHAT domain-containing protein